MHIAPTVGHTEVDDVVAQEAGVYLCKFHPQAGSKLFLLIVLCIMQGLHQLLGQIEIVHVSLLGCLIQDLA